MRTRCEPDETRIGIGFAAGSDPGRIRFGAELPELKLPPLGLFASGCFVDSSNPADCGVASLPLVVSGKLLNPWLKVGQRRPGFPRWARLAGESNLR
jgi:hypothetical protein